MRHLIMLLGCAASLAAPTIEAASLNKCTDAQGRVTYSNLPCRNAREVRAVEIDPSPAPDPVKPRAAKPPPVQAAPAPTPLPNESATLHLNTQSTTGKPAPRVSARQCDSLTDKLGKVFDKMDQARRNGYTQEQMNKWDQEIKDLEGKKQQSGCF
jgi:hypothetical protein